MFQFDWDDANRDHIALHHVAPEEAEQVLNGITIELESYEAGEERLDEIGITSAGRILYIITTIRDYKLRVVTAYDAPKRLKDTYLRHQRKYYE